MTFAIMTLNGTTEIFGETPEIQERLAPTRIAQHGQEQRIPGVEGDSTMKLVPGVEYALVPYGDSKIWIRTSGFTYFADGTHRGSDGIIHPPYYRVFGGTSDWKDSRNLAPRELSNLLTSSTLKDRIQEVSMRVFSVIFPVKKRGEVL